MTERKGKAQDQMMRIDSSRFDASGVVAACAILGLSACGDKTLDLGKDQATPPAVVDGPRYATRQELAAEGSAEPGVPTVMATHQYGAVALAVDDARVYWAAEDNPRLPGQYPRECSVVRSCAKDDCAGTVITYGYLQGASYLAVNKGSVFWQRWTGMQPTQQIVSCPISGCKDSPAVIATGISPISLAADDAYVYWHSSDAAILKCPVHGCAGPPELVASLDHFSPRDSLTLDETHLYWLIGNGAPKPGGIATVPIDGSAPVRFIVDGLGIPQSLAVRRETVFWSEYGSGGAVKSCPVTGCRGAPTVLASALEFSALLDVDGDRAYWFLSTGDWSGSRQDASAQLVQCSVDGCGSSPTVLTNEPHGPQAMAIDASHIYWVAIGEHKMNESGLYNDSTIQRLRRPD